MLVRMHEANCKLEHPSVEEANFRVATMKKLGMTFNLREMRAVAITGPATNASARK